MSLSVGPGLGAKAKDRDLEAQRIVRQDRESPVVRQVPHRQIVEDGIVHDDRGRRIDDQETMIAELRKQLLAIPDWNPCLEVTSRPF